MNLGALIGSVAAAIVLLVFFFCFLRTGFCWSSCTDRCSRRSIAHISYNGTKSDQKQTIAPDIPYYKPMLSKIPVQTPATCDGIIWNRNNSPRSALPLPRLPHEDLVVPMSDSVVQYQNEYQPKRLATCKTSDKLEEKTLSPKLVLSDNNNHAGGKILQGINSQFVFFPVPSEPAPGGPIKKSLSNTHLSVSTIRNASHYQIPPDCMYSDTGYISLNNPTKLQVERQESTPVNQVKENTTAEQSMSMKAEIGSAVESTTAASSKVQENTTVSSLDNATTVSEESGRSSSLPSKWRKNYRQRKTTKYNNKSSKTTDVSRVRLQFRKTFPDRASFDGSFLSNPHAAMWTSEDNGISIVKLDDEMKSAFLKKTKSFRQQFNALD